jgi:hypothetical protein
MRQLFELNKVFENNSKLTAEEKNAIYSAVEKDINGLENLMLKTMRAVNVITKTGGVVDKVKTFLIPFSYSIEKHNKIVEKAEEYYFETAKSFWEDEEYFDAHDVRDSDYYEYGDREVFITWSELG